MQPWLNYNNLIDKLGHEGNRVESRLGSSYELIGEQVCFNPGLLVWRPGFNRALGWMELLQLIAGVFEPEQIARVAPKAPQDLFGPVSAYGPRLYAPEGAIDGSYPDLEPGSHFHRVIKELWGTPNTRRAVLFIGKDDDTPDKLACTLTYQLLLRNGSLHANVNMRSWDVILGLPYDIVMFGGLLLAIAHLIEAKPGIIKVTAGSLHLYDSTMSMRPIVRKTTEFSLDLQPKDKGFQWAAFRMVCKNQVYQDWGESRTPYFIKVNEWESH